MARTTSPCQAGNVRYQGHLALGSTPHSEDGARREHVSVVLRSKVGASSNRGPVALAQGNILVASPSWGPPASPSCLHSYKQMPHLTPC